MIGLDEAVAKTVKKLTKNCRIELIKFLEIEDNEFIKYENFKQPIPIKTLFKICNFLSISFNQFCLEARISQKQIPVDPKEMLYFKQEFMNHLKN